MEILTSSQISLADRLTIEKIGIPSIVLMENAAISFVEELKKIVHVDDKIAIIVGSGNNGGDGLAIARHLFNSGYKVDIFLTESESKFTKDPLINYNILKSLPVVISSIDDFSPYNFDVIIDAIFGTGLNRALDERYSNIVNIVNNSAKKVIAVDIPSGLSGDSNRIIGVNIKADYTITFFRPKIPHKVFPAKKYCGKVIVKDISIPQTILSDLNPSVFEIDIKNLPLIIKRKLDSHKGDYGHAVIIAGSDGKSGAAIIASKACLRVGAGLLTTIIPESISLAFATSIPEAMSLPIGKNRFLSYEDIDKIYELCSNKSLVAIGPGIGTDENTKKLVKELIKKLETPIILDADGLNCISLSDLKYMSYRAILTPHIGEFSRLTGIDKGEILDKPIEIAKDFSTKHQVVLVLKSANTFIAEPDGNVYIFSGGIPALAKGGSGDCLTGIIAGFVSQKYSLTDAAKLGVCVLGKTAETVSNNLNESSVLATDIINNISGTLNEIRDIQLR
ncbi:MAG: NAD(P)H-hydrate dehydratase [Calditerrivibrio sp.]|nr:NAD(P)H-hydrate dehydratase [Calditerrivibrio sp.]MCA1932825.1 NAD(P)H-hydrate dehydratase [Calditerrivibrio sp.]